MGQLFQMGGILFMSIITIEFVGVILLTAWYMLRKDKQTKDRDLIKSTGLLALVTGVLGQLIGLFSAFEYIEQAGSVSPNMLAGGIKVSMITTMYGLLVYLVSIIIWLVLQKLYPK